jgi:TonB family protein
MRPTINLLFVLTLAAVCAIGQTPADAGAKLISSADLVMPEEAVAAGIDGQLAIAVSIDKTGAAKRVEILAGPAWPCGTSPKRELEKVRDAIRDNILASKFAPAYRDGKPQAAELFLSFAIGKAHEELQRRKNLIDPSTGTSDRPAIMQSGVLAGRALRLPKPDYPASARYSRAAGAVTVWVLYDEQGKVEKAGAINGHPQLQDAARDAACNARFSPTMLKGQPIKVAGVITYNFMP